MVAVAKLEICCIKLDMGIIIWNQPETKLCV